MTISCILVFRAVADPSSGPYDRLTAKVVAKVMTYQHYEQYALDDEISHRLFDAYLHRLDGNRSYLLASDIQAFRKYYNILDELLDAGELTFAYELHARLIKRVEERIVFAEERLSSPFDFTVAETLVIDRSEAAWPADTAGADDLWRRQLKDRCLRQVLPRPRLLELEGPDAFKPSAQLAKRILRPYRQYLQRLKEKDAKDILETFLTTFTSVYDPHSTYMGPLTKENFDMNMNLSMEGIGAYLGTSGQYIVVRGLVSGGPSEAGGKLKPGDRIVEVEQADGSKTDTVELSMSKAVQLIRGPKGSRVYLHVLQMGDDADAGPQRIEIVRGKVELHRNEAKSWTANSPKPHRVAIGGSTKEVDPATVGVDAAAVGVSDHYWPVVPESGPDDVLVVSLPVFYSDFEARNAGQRDYKSTTRDVKRLILAQGADNVRGLILDLRGNHGGSLAEAVDLTGLFLTSGPVVQVRRAMLSPKIHRDTDESFLFDGPLIVLVDRDSASSSEIVAAAIQDYDRGLIVGESRTHGKGTVQSVFPIEKIARVPRFRHGRSPGTLKFTVSKFYRVTGESTQLRGVTPDIQLPTLRDHRDIGEAHLKYALLWDVMPKVAYTKVRGGVQKFLPVLRARLEKRLAADDAYQSRVALVAASADRKNRNELPLQLDARRELAGADDDWSAQVRTLHDDDFLMDQALSIMEDLISVWEE